MPSATVTLLPHLLEPLCAGPDTAQLVDRYVTPNDRHFVRNHGPVPAIDRSIYRLRIDGLVERRLELGLHELAERFAPHEETVTLQCAGNRRQELHAYRAIDGEVLWSGDAVGTATWRGIRLVDLLFAAGIAPGASDVWFEGRDAAVTPNGDAPFGASVSIDRALRPDVLVAFFMNGEPLPPEHGAPARLVVPGAIGARSVKWLARITLADRPSPNHFQARGYRIPDPESDTLGPPLEEAPINAFIATPDDHAVVSAGVLLLRGYAAPSGTATVATVEVQLDGAAWQPARIVDEPRAAAWVRWQSAIHLGPGLHLVRVRASDTAGATQPPSVRTVWNARGYRNNAIQEIEVTAR